MMNTSLELYKFNKELARSIQQNPWLYSLMISVSCITIIGLNIANLYFSPIDIKTFIELAYFVVFFDIIAVTVRLANRAFIKPYQMAVFPLSKWKKFLFHFGILLMDSKTLIYLSTAVCFIFFYTHNSFYLGALISLVVFFLLLTNILSWTAVIYTIFAKYIDKMGDKIRYVVFFALILMFMQDFMDNFMFNVPIIKHAGNALYGLWEKNPQTVWENLSLLLGSLAFPLIMLFAISKLKKIK